MALILNGTDGLSDVDGTAATPAIRGTDANTGIFFPAADTIAFSEGGTEAMRINGSGNVLVGTTTATYGAANRGLIEINGSTDSVYALKAGGTGVGYIQGASTAVNFNTGSAIPLTLGTNNSERMRIDSSGAISVNTTTPVSVGVGTHVLSLKSVAAAAEWGVGPTSSFGNFYVKNGAATGVLLTTAATSWASSSDERIKTAITPFENPLEKICSLRAGTGRYLEEDENMSRSFLVAQDVQKILPEAVDIGEDENNTLQLRYTDIIPLLVASVKELKATVDAQAARIAALENPPVESATNE
jgi:hypothetical protein